MFECFKDNFFSDSYMICSVLYDVDTITINVDNDVFLKSQSNYPQKPAFYKYSCLMHFVILCSTEIIERSDIYYKKRSISLCVLQHIWLS